MANPTVADVIKQAQVMAGDKDGVKWSPESYLAYLNTGIQVLYQRHPSAFYVSSVITSAPATVALGDEIPVLPRFAEALEHYVVSKCLIEGAAGNDEHNAKLAKTNMDLFIALSA